LFVRTTYGTGWLEKEHLGLVCPSYANGLFSSRHIERATYRDVAVRYLTADQHPDHDTDYSISY
jgi:transposase